VIPVVACTSKEFPVITPLPVTEPVASKKTSIPLALKLPGPSDRFPGAETETKEEVTVNAPVPVPVPSSINTLPVKSVPSVTVKLVVLKVVLPVIVTVPPSFNVKESVVREFEPKFSVLPPLNVNDVRSGLETSKVTEPMVGMVTLSLRPGEVPVVVVSVLVHFAPSDHVPAPEKVHV
jgi:hypothetical protein